MSFNILKISLCGRRLYCRAVCGRASGARESPSSRRVYGPALRLARNSIDQFRLRLRRLIPFGGFTEGVERVGSAADRLRRRIGVDGERLQSAMSAQPHNLGDRQPCAHPSRDRGMATVMKTEVFDFGVATGRREAALERIPDAEYRHVTIFRRHLPEPDKFGMQPGCHPDGSL